jgi:hypothetical protein
MNSIVEKNRNLPELPRNEQIYSRADQIMIRRYGPRRPGMGAAESSLADLDAILPDAQAVLDDLRALAQPATKLEIAKQLAILVKCYPNIGTADDGAVYGRLLIEDVAATQPSIGDLENACRQLRRTSRFCPVIAEVLGALEAAKHQRQEITHKITTITKSRDQQIREVEKERQRHQEYLEYHRARYQPSMAFDPTVVPL